MTETYINIPRPKVQEGSSFSATAHFRNGDASEVPTTASYRIDCISTGKVLQDWTALTPAASISIPITSTHNEIQDSYNKNEKKQLTVSADVDLSTQTRDVRTWKVINIRGF